MLALSSSALLLLDQCLCRLDIDSGLPCGNQTRWFEFLKSAENSADRVVVGWKRALLLSFVFGFVVRLIPEVLLSPYPIGFDPIWYAWRIKSGVVWSHWSQVFSTWLLYGVLVPLYNAAHVNLFGLLKVTAALLFGFNACGIFYFARKVLNWTVNRALFASVFFSLQAAALFFSANLYRNMLGLGVLLFTLPLIRDDLKSTKKLVGFALLSMLVVLSHEIASVVLFAVVLGFLVTRFLGKTGVNVPRLLMAICPAVVLFLVSFAFRVLPVSYQVEANVISLSEPSGNYQGALFFLRNYLAVQGTGNQQAVYLDLVSQVFLFFVALYVLVLPFVLVGFSKDAVLGSWTAMLLMGSFGVVLIPVFAPYIWSRWMLMLVYPFTFYAVDGIVKVLRRSRSYPGSTLQLSRFTRLRRTAVTMIIIVPILCGLVYTAMALPAQVSVVPLSDFDDTVKAMRWLDSQMDGGAALLTHFAFSWWSRLCLDESCTRIYFKDDVEGALSLALQNGFSSVYFVWWNERIGWFSLAVPSGFVSVFDSGRISVFKYVE